MRNISYNDIFFKNYLFYKNIAVIADNYDYEFKNEKYINFFL